MARYHYTYSSKYSIEQLYQLVCDIEQYPEFLPWCSAARIIEESDDLIIADLIISYKAFSEHYRSKVELSPQKKGKAEIHVSMISGPFKYLHNHWKFKTSKSNNGTEIDFSIDFAFKSSLLETLIGIMFNKAAQKMVSAFENRANTLYGATYGTASSNRNRGRTKKAP